MSTRAREALDVILVHHLHATHHHYRLNANAAAASEHEARRCVARWRDIAEELKPCRLVQSPLNTIIAAKRNWSRPRPTIPEPLRLDALHATVPRVPLALSYRQE
jgi:hypothetical protein